MKLTTTALSTERDHDYEREKWEEDHCPECRALVNIWGNCRCVIEEDPPSLESLVREVMFWHADPESPNYNECDKSPCEWCSNASGLLATPCSELGGEKSECPHWQNGCCICENSDNQHRTLLVDVLNYRRGLGRYDLSKLPEDERSMAALEAWEELEARIENAL